MRPNAERASFDGVVGSLHVGRAEAVIAAADARIIDWNSILKW